MTRTVGLLGGTFDPPHVGHLAVARAALDALDLDEVRLLVAGDPWMKEGVSPADVRLRLARAAVADVSGLVVDDREARRDGPTYTIDTLRELVAEEPDVDWVFVLGADAAASLPRWRGARELLELCRFVAVPRPGHPLPDLPEGVELLGVDPVPVSSTRVRDAAAAGESLEGLVPPAVARIVEELGLYRPGDGTPRR